jgi:hypothetical protein
VDSETGGDAGGRGRGGAESGGRGGVFAIEVRSRVEVGGGGDDSAGAFGRIVIGDFTETFVVPLGFWGESDYRASCQLPAASWRRAFEVLDVGDPRAVACLMTSMTDPVSSNFLVCWPMYREGEDVCVQNAIVLLDEIEGRFDPQVPWGSVGPRRGVDDDGNRVSEWATSMGSLITAQEKVNSSGTVTADIQSGYDDFGDLSSYADAAGNISKYTYNLAGQAGPIRGNFR